MTNPNISVSSGGLRQEVWLKFCSVKLLVNGEPKIFERSLTVADLINELELTPERLAVELNRKIVRRTDWTETELNDNDAIEIVHFVGGGGCHAEKRVFERQFARNE